MRFFFSFLSLHSLGVFHPVVHLMCCGLCSWCVSVVSLFPSCFLFLLSPFFLFFFFEVGTEDAPACRQARRQAESLLEKTRVQHRPRRRRHSPCCRWLPSATRSRKRKACHHHLPLPSRHHQSPRRQSRQRAAALLLQETKLWQSRVLMLQKGVSATSSRPRHRRSLWSRRRPGGSTRTCATRAWRRPQGGSFSISTSVSPFLVLEDTACSPACFSCVDAHRPPDNNPRAVQRPEGV